MGAEARLPHQPPRGLTPERIAAGAALLGSVQVTLLVLRGAPWTMQLETTLIVALYVALAAHLATRRGTTVTAAVAGAVRWIPLCGAAAAVSLALVSCAVQGDFGELLAVLGWSVPIAVVGFLASLPAVLAALPLALVASLGRDRPSHEAPIRALVGAGIWLLAVAGLCVAPHDGGSAWTLAPGALMVAWGLVWLARRGRFIRRALAGQEAAFVIVAINDEASRAGLLPYRPIGQPCIVDALAAVAPPAGGAYRDAERPVPLCLVGRGA